MKSVVIFSLLVAVATAALFEKLPSLSVGELSDVAAPRIIDGTPAKLGQFPWAVLLHVYVAGGGFGMCGGALISDRWIMTAAHCVKQGIMFRAHLGSVNRKLQEQGRLIINTTEAYAHPKHDPQWSQNDVGLIALPSPVSFTNNIQAIRLPAQTDYLGAGVNGFLAGWGRTSNEPASYSDDLLFAKVTTITNTECVKVFTHFRVAKAIICTVGHPNEGQCNGDSGGPLSTLDADGKSTLRGIVNFGFNGGCGTDKPSALSRPDQHLDWIKQVTGLPL